MEKTLSRIEEFFYLSDTQKEQFRKLFPLYRDWNEKINVISRKDIDNLGTHHILHSLSIAQFISFKPGTKVLDLGTGGGFPGIPLAILFPETEFTLIDGTAKKLKVVKSIRDEIGLQNVSARHQRIEQMGKKEKFDFVTARGVKRIDTLVSWVRPHIAEEMNNAIPNGLLALKGGKRKRETEHIPDDLFYDIFEINTYFSEEFFSNKYLLYIQI